MQSLAVAPLQRESVLKVTIPRSEDIAKLLDQLDSCIADDLESQWLDFKPWEGAKDSMRVAVEYAVCFANAGGGVVVFGVADQVRGRAAAIHGVGNYDIDVWKRGVFDATRPNLAVDIDEIAVQEGTGRLLLMRVPKGAHPPYGTAKGYFTQRIGKNCMPMDSQGFARSQVASGAVDWSGQPAEGLTLEDLDPVEIARGRNIVKRLRASSELSKMNDAEFLQALGALRQGKVARAGLLLFGRDEVLQAQCPQHQVHYVYEGTNNSILRNDSYQCGLLQILDRIEQAFTGPSNPEQELTTGLFKLRVPAFSIEVVREAILNAVTHRDYSDPGEVLLRHKRQEIAITNPGGFLGNITPRNILRQEPVARNRALAEALQKLGLVERAGIGRQRIFMPPLSFGKRIPIYETDGTRVTLRVYDGAFDEGMALLVAKWRGDGRDVDLDTLLILTCLRDNAFIDTAAAADLLQVSREQARTVLDQHALPRTGFLERRGRTKAATYHLNKAVSGDMHGKAAYTHSKGIDAIRYKELVRQFIVDQGCITPKECRELLGFGESRTAKSAISRLLTEWSASDGILRPEGYTTNRKYFLRDEGGEADGEKG